MQLKKKSLLVFFVLVGFPAGSVSLILPHCCDWGTGKLGEGELKEKSNYLIQKGLMGDGRRSEVLLFRLFAALGFAGSEQWVVWKATWQIFKGVLRGVSIQS